MVFEKKVYILNKIPLCALIFSPALSEASLMLEKIQRDVIITLDSSSPKVQVIIVNL
jgi:hypothetical protein